MKLQLFIGNIKRNTDQPPKAGELLGGKNADDR